MKKILLFAVAAVAAICAQAQPSVQFVYNGEVLEDGAVVDVLEYDPTMGEMPWHVGFKNNTGKDVEVQISYDSYENKYENLEGMGFGDQMTICTTQCVAGASVTAPPFIVNAAGEPDCEVHIAFGIMSDAMMGYKDAFVKADFVMVNTANEDDLTYVTVVFDYSRVAALHGASMANNIKVFQRGDNLVCNYAFDAVAERSLVVTNIVGARVATVALDGNNGEVALDRLPKGVYVYTLVEGGRNVKSQKIVVR
ncbi:MAG: T9SS type A sorting domain-containing protein [Bacteroidaceae bacterium]|nr:T9SS type A sorting domain-containing protein [Bacteroidaceae bacterium]